MRRNPSTDGIEDVQKELLFAIRELIREVNDLRRALDRMPTEIGLRVENTERRAPGGYGGGLF